MYGVFDVRPQHSNRPFMFTIGNGKYAPAVYDTKEEAADMAQKMNATTDLTSYVVRQITTKGCTSVVSPKARERSGRYEL